MLVEKEDGERGREREEGGERKRMRESERGGEKEEGSI